MVGRCLFRAVLPARPRATAMLLLQSRLSFHCTPFCSRSRGRASLHSASPHSTPQRFSTSRRAQTRAANPARSHRPAPLAVSARCRPSCLWDTTPLQADGGIQPRCSCKPPLRSQQRDGAPCSASQRRGSALLLGCTFTGNASVLPVTSYR